MLLVALAAAAVQPQPGTLKTFGDWTVGCDNVRHCQAVALVPPAEDRARYLLLVIHRDAGPDGRPTLSFSTEAALPANGTTLRVDGKPVARFGGMGPLPFNAALASALGQGRRATLTDARGRIIASASLTGLAATFLHMDDQQRRLGTAGALIRRGSRPDVGVPTAPPLPRIVRPPISARPPRTITSAAAARLIGPDAASCEYATGPVAPKAVRLDVRTSMVLVPHPCGNGAYNYFTSVYLLDERARVRPATFDRGVGMSETADNQLTNGDWDAKERLLNDDPKARGLGDCGGTASFAWDGTRFRLTHEAMMGECRGSTDYITTWRAAVTTAR